MSKITSTETLTKPNYIKPIMLNYTLKGKQKQWEAVITHSSVSILLYHREKNAFVLVKQLRPAVLNSNKKDGYMYEMCAGIIDKDTSNEQIAKEEVLEECGYDIPVQSLEKVSSFYTNVGISGAKQTIYYAELSEAMKINEGGGLDEEEIEVIYIPLEDAKEFMFDESYQKTSGVIMSFYWFFDKKYHTIQTR
jgi:UDP-sugar diphosphatase